MARGFVKKRGEAWYAYWRDPEGKQRTKAVGRLKKDAEDYLAQVTADLASGTYQRIIEVAFSDFVERWLKDCATPNVKPSTLDTYSGVTTTHLVPFFGKRKLDSITADSVQRYIAEKLEAGLNAKTIRNHLTLLKSIFKQAVIWGYLKRNPAEYIKAPRAAHREMDFLTPDEIRVFLANVDAEHRAFFTTAVLTGMRLGELCALQWGDIDWHSGTIRVRRSIYRGAFVTPKSKRSIRAIGISPYLRHTLVEHKLSSPVSDLDLVFCNKLGMPLDQSNLRHRVFEPALRRAGLRKIRIHDLRHTFASLLIHQGENLKYIQSQLGHASISTTLDRYGHLMPDVHIGASARLDETVFGIPAQNSAYNPLTSPSETGAQKKKQALRPASLVVAGAGFEPATFGL
ncbi:MAG: tyrosine-type recombinase/integrase [Candidatus Aquicultorales bacterium]